MTEEGDFDYEYLDTRFKELQDKNSLKIGAFSAGSNITGNIFDVDLISIICHRYKALAIFDYAAVAPYVEINMNGINKFRPFNAKIEQN
jgi:selenocysteine lyase/cysteine desulfurase